MSVKYYGAATSEMTLLEKENRELARIAARESFVLLKNSGALPLKNKRIALYGMGARKTVKGGLGSGSVEERYSVSIEEGLKNAGYEITSDAWLDDYDKEYDVTYKEWHNMVEEQLIGLTSPMDIIPKAHSYVYQYPSGRRIEPSDIEESATDTAIYVIMRQAGECRDRRLEKGDYFLTDCEKVNIEVVAKCYKHAILVINIGGVVDLSVLDEAEGIDAVVFFVQGGEEGGNALADVLSGNQSFCGKLTDTWPLKYEDVPYGDEFSYLNGELAEENYKEGIFVGYRYYNSFGKAVRYPFGFGLSYTDFEIGAAQTKVVGSKVGVSVKVKNAGHTYSGKEVIQLYVSQPKGNLKKAYQVLAAFGKTKQINPGDEQEVNLEFDLTQVASYSEKESSWLLEAGDYILRIGTSSNDTKIISVLELPAGVTTKVCKNNCILTKPLKELEAPEKDTIPAPEGVRRIVIDVNAFTTVRYQYAVPAVVETKEETKILDSLTIEEMAEFLLGGPLQNPPEGSYEITGAGGKTTTALLDKGISNVVFSDGPAGVNITNRVCFMEDGSVKPVEIPERYNWGMLAKMAKGRLTGSEGTIVYRYATAWPVELLLAQSFDTELVEKVGEAVGKELKEFGITLWLAPGMNLHRNPLCGRNFEYYSEDPYVTGKMAAALTKGVQKIPGVGVAIKHFCCNNTEDNRFKSNSQVNEQALRELYLKGFEIAIQESKPLSLMSSYNLLNGIYTPNNYELLTDILRCEFGFEGLVMSDWNSCSETTGRSELAAVSGNDILMPGNDWDREQILKGIKTGVVKKEDVRRSACRVLRVILLKS